MNIREENRKRSLYFDDGNGHIVFAPQGWADEIGQESEDGEGWEFQCYHGDNEDTLAFEDRQGNEYLTTDCIQWFLVSDLAKMREVTEEEARQLDPDLFTLLDAIDSGEAQ